MMKRFTLAGCFAFLFLACAPTQKPQTEPPAAEGASIEAAAAPAPDPKVARFSVVGVSDFHGWLLPLEPKDFNRYYGGLANLASLFVHEEHLRPETSIFLDNGDMWTGPTESTLLRGEPVIEAYNELGLAAANIANHEFDFGMEILKARVSEAKFPFLGANLVNAGTSENPPFIKPFTIVERDGVKVGILGLSFLDTPRTTLAKHVAGLEFRPYGETLTKWVPELRKGGAEVIVVLFHDRLEVIEKVLSEHKDLGLALVIAGQEHRPGSIEVDGTPVVNPGPFGRSFVRFDVEVDRETRKLLSVTHKIVNVVGELGNPPHPPSPEIQAIVEAARVKAKSLSGTAIGRLSAPAPVGSFAASPLGHLIVDSWLQAFPEVDVAICNHGALRQALGAGVVTIGDLTSVLPFENNLYIVRLTGAQLKSQLATDDPVVAGVTWNYRQADGKRSVVSVVDRVGQPIKDKNSYTVVINDFMYHGGDGYAFKELDPQPNDTGLSLREPLIRAFRLAETSGRAIDPPVGPRAAQTK